MKDNERFQKTPSSEESYWDAAVQAATVHKAECPRLISLIEAISMPITDGYFNFSAHLLDPLLHELSQGHIDSNQAVVMYLRILEIHENNLKEIDSLKDGVLDSSLDEFKRSLITSISIYAEHFQIESRKYGEHTNPATIKQPLCREVLTNRFVGR